MKLIPFRGRGNVASYRSDLDDLMTRLLDDDLEMKLPVAFSRAAVPPVNIAESEKSWTVSVELPGLDEKDIQVQILGNHMQISAERKWEAEKKGKEFHRVESQYGAFQRTIRLPENVRLDPDSITASYKQGMLEISVPKVEPTPAARISVHAS
jgi:HSP20 family protein